MNDELKWQQGRVRLDTGKLPETKEHMNNLCQEVMESSSLEIFQSKLQRSTWNSTDTMILSPERVTGWVNLCSLHPRYLFVTVTTMCTSLICSLNSRWSDATNARVLCPLFSPDSVITFQFVPCLDSRMEPIEAEMIMNKYGRFPPPAPKYFLQCVSTFFIKYWIKQLWGCLCMCIYTPFKISFSSLGLPFGQAHCQERVLPEPFSFSWCEQLLTRESERPTVSRG